MFCDRTQKLSFFMQSLVSTLITLYDVDYIFILAYWINITLGFVILSFNGSNICQITKIVHTVKISLI